MITGLTMLTPNGSGAGAGADCTSSWRMYCCTGVQSVPPHSTGQCGTAQPLALRMRCQRTVSSFDRCRPSTILRRMSSGRLPRMKARTSSRKASSSGVKRRSMTVPVLSSGDLEEARGALAAADAHRDDGVPDAAALAFDQRVAGHPRPAHAVGMPDRDRAAIDVESVVRDAEPVAAIDHLAGERL